MSRDRWDVSPGQTGRTPEGVPPKFFMFIGFFSFSKKGIIAKGVVSLEESLESLKSLNSLVSLENGRIPLCFPESGGSLESLESIESLEN